MATGWNNPANTESKEKNGLRRVENPPGFLLRNSSSLRNSELPILKTFRFFSSLCDCATGLEPGAPVLRQALLAIHGPALGRLEGDFAFLTTV